MCSSDRIIALLPLHIIQEKLEAVALLIQKISVHFSTQPLRASSSSRVRLKAFDIAPKICIE
jgi:hypothetical protein